MGLDSKNLRFNYYAALEDETPIEKRGRISISEKTVCSVEGNTLHIQNIDVRWKLTSDEHDDAVHWHRILTAAVMQQQQVASRLPIVARVHQILLCNCADPPTYEEISATLATEYGHVLFHPAKGDVEALVKHVRQLRHSFRPFSHAVSSPRTKHPTAPRAVVYLVHAHAYRVLIWCLQSDGMPNLSRLQAHLTKHMPKVAAGWFVKKPDGLGKSQKRWFELHNDEIKYYAHESLGRGTSLS